MVYYYQRVSDYRRKKRKRYRKIMSDVGKRLDLVS